MTILHHIKPFNATEEVSINNFIDDLKSILNEGEICCIFRRRDDAIQGKATEMTVNATMEKAHSERIRPAGATDFIYNHKYYDIKQNGSVLKYERFKKWVRGSNRIIYATHVDYVIVHQTDDFIAIMINLTATDFFVVDRYEFIDFLKSINGIKYNASRECYNVQTMYNYTKDAYHGAKGRKLEEWMQENALEDDVLDVILSKVK
jgi:hypothetical protein